MKPRRHGRAGTGGFTLVEALVAIFLMGMVLTALATVTAQWLPNWHRGFARVQRIELLNIALDRLVADLAAVEFVAPGRQTTRPLFEGTELSVTFVRTAIGPNSRFGLEVVRISESADRQGPMLVRARAPFAPNSGTTDQFYFADPVVLMRAPYRLSFAYAGKDRVWQGAWRDAPLLPSAIRLTIRDAATDRPLTVSTAAVVHAELPAECVQAKSGSVCGKPGQAKAGAKPDSNDSESSDTSAMRRR